MNYYHSVSELVGKPPLLRLSHIEQANGLNVTLLAKLECMNPVGSVKDRVALSMITDAEESGRLAPGGTIIEPTSGNTGIGIAALAASRGYRVIITMPDTMSVERQRLMKAYGAEVILTDGKLGMSGAIAKAEELAKEIPGAIVAGQFVNPANPHAHYTTTGPEIWADTDGIIDVFVAGAGTGGTVTGTGRYLKEQNPNLKVVAIEPATSAVLSGGKAGAHGLQGIGAGFIPEILDTTVIDEVMPVTDEAAYDAVRALARLEGVLVGISSGAALSAAVELAKRPESAGKTIVVLRRIPVSGICLQRCLRRDNMPATDNIIFTRIWEDDDFFEANIQFSTNTIIVSCDLYLDDLTVNELSDSINGFVVDSKKTFTWNVRKYNSVDSPRLFIEFTEQDKHGRVVLQVDLKNEDGVTAAFGINTELGLLQSFANRIHRLKTASVGQKIALIEFE